MAIIADYREQISGVPQNLKQISGEDIIYARLFAGDYILHSKLCVERKTCVDFASSLIDGRLFSQASRMKQRFEASFMIIEGENLYHANSNLHPNAVRGALVSLSVVWRIPILFCRDSQETAETIHLLCQQTDCWHREIPLRHGYRPKRLRNRAVYVLAGLPGVGPGLASRLLEHFGSLRDACAADIEKLAEVDGIGFKKAKAITNIFDERFKE